MFRRQVKRSQNRAVTKSGSSKNIMPKIGEEPVSLKTISYYNDDNLNIDIGSEIFPTVEKIDENLVAWESEINQYDRTQFPKLGIILEGKTDTDGIELQIEIKNLVRPGKTETFHPYFNAEVTLSNETASYKFEGRIPQHLEKRTYISFEHNKECGFVIDYNRREAQTRLPQLLYFTNTPWILQDLNSIHNNKIQILEVKNN